MLHFKQKALFPELILSTITVKDKDSICNCALLIADHCRINVARFTSMLVSHFR